MSDLSEDLLEEILCRVPATSLKRLRFTCKRWNSLLNYRRIARKHFNKAEKQQLTLMLTNIFRVCSTSVDLHGIPSLDVKGEISLNNSPSILQVFHYQGLLLCTIREDNIILVWNPCTGQTRWIHTKWIQSRRDAYKFDHTYYLGSYQDNKSYDNHKILSIRSDGYKQEFAIYEINNSNPWRILDFTPDFNFLYISSTRVSLKGKTYWFAWDGKDKKVHVFLVSFDYTTERFERLLLPFQCMVDCLKNMALTSVRDEKLCALLQRKNTCETEIWVTNKIDETKGMSWIKVLTMDSPKRDPWNTICWFLFDEEKKIVMMQCEKINLFPNTKRLVYIVGENKNVIQVDYEVDRRAFFLSYVPSFLQIK